MAKPDTKLSAMPGPNLPYARFEVRAVAFALDIIVLFSILLCFVAAGGLQTLIRSNFGEIDPPQSAFYVWAGFLWAFVPFGILYHTLLLAYRGQTVGKIAVHIKVVRTDGGSLTLTQSFLRCLGHVASALPLLLGFFIVIRSRQRQALHDMIAGTTVVKEA